MNKKLVVADLDGTLLDVPNGISPHYIEQINDLIDQGLNFTIATGRDLENTLKAIPGLKCDYPAILTNGAVLADLNTEEIIEVQTLPKLVSDRIIEMGANHNLNPMVFASYNKKLNRIQYLKGDWGKAPVKPLNETDFMPYLNDSESVVSIQFHTLKENLDPLYKQVLNKFTGKATIIYMSDISYQPQGVAGEWFWLEVIAKDAGKADMLKRLARHYSFSMEDLIVFGDNHNDIDMIKAAGLGIAMGNAPEEVKKIANKVVLPNFEGGLVQYLQKHKKALLN
ncbi:MAG: Cof-type HAD-IIB family hydrolase [Promethearchaeota archaeon]